MPFKNKIPCFVHSSSAVVKQNKRSRVYNPKIPIFIIYLPFGNDVNFGNYHALQTSRSQPNAQEYLLKVQHFSNFSLVSLSPHSRLRRSAERIRQGEGRWSRPPKTARERSDLIDKFQFRESETEAKTKKTRVQTPVP